MKNYNFDELVTLAVENPVLFCKKYKSDKNIFSIRGTWGENIFHYLCLEGYEESVKTMIKMGADVNIRNSFGETPLFSCVFIGKISIIETLLQSGADPNISNEDGRTALHQAYGSTLDNEKKQYIISLLLSHGANPEVLDNLGLKPCDY